MADRAVTETAKKRKRGDPDATHPQRPINRQQLLAQAKSRFPTLLKYLPHPRMMLFVRQAWDDRGSEWKLLIGHLYREGAKLPLYAYIKDPFWVTYTFGVGHKLSAVNLDLDNSVRLLQPFCAIGTAPRTAGLEAVILFYFVVCHRWDEYDVSPESFINLDVLHKACRTVRDGTALQRRRDMVEMQEAFPDTIEDSLSSGEDSDEDSMFVKTCKRCRRIEREDSHCRTEGHIEKLVEQAHKIKTLEKHQDLLIKETEMLVREVRERDQEIEDHKQWRDIVEDTLKWKEVVRIILEGGGNRFSKEGKRQMKQELGIAD